jgi:hypothetical protein
MNITNHIDTVRQRLEIRVAGRIGAENACGIIQHAIVEAYGSNYREVALDLRQASLDHSTSLFRLHSLLQLFKAIILQKDLRVTVLFSMDNAEQWMYLDKAEEFDGITMRYFTNREAALHFLGKDEEISTAVH